MATAREHFALDWIKADLLETLNEARIALDDYAEQSGDETRLRAGSRCPEEISVVRD